MLYHIPWWFLELFDDFFSEKTIYKVFACFCVITYNWRGKKIVKASGCIIRIRKHFQRSKIK